MCSTLLYALTRLSGSSESHHFGTGQFYIIPKVQKRTAVLECWDVQQLSIMCSHSHQACLRPIRHKKGCPKRPFGTASKIKVCALSQLVRISPNLLSGQALSRFHGCRLINKKADSQADVGYPLKWAQKRQRNPLCIRGSFACNCLCSGLLFYCRYTVNGQDLPYVNPSNYCLVFCSRSPFSQASYR